MTRSGTVFRPLILDITSDRFAFVKTSVIDSLPIINLSLRSTEYPMTLPRHPRSFDEFLKFLGHYPNKFIGSGCVEIPGEIELFNDV